MKLHVGWVEQGTYGLHDKVYQGGCWGLFKANGDLFVKPVSYGKNERVKQQLEKVAELWNGSEGR